MKKTILRWIAVLLSASMIIGSSIMSYAGTDDSDTDKTTESIDNSTTLKDGEYTPDAFAFSGGTGKVEISCTKITVTNAETYAELVFDSSKYGYVKAGGKTYYPTVGSNTTVFVIPVELNKNNTVIGMTTAMSEAHEISYSIFIYLAEAAGGSVYDSSQSGLVSSSNDTMDQKAPEIVGLSYKSETKVRYAKYFRIFRYEDGIVLLEIDTAADNEEDPADPAESVSARTSVEDITKLYSGNTVKYLIVPEEAEIPVGLDKDMIIIRREKDETLKVYAASEAVLDFMDRLGQSDLAAALGVKTAKDAYKKAVFAGFQDDPDYRQIMKADVNIAVLSPEILSEDKEEEDDLLQTVTEKFISLDIPVIIDRSQDEKTEAAKQEWVKVYKILFGG